MYQAVLEATVVVVQVMAPPLAAWVQVVALVPCCGAPPLKSSSSTPVSLAPVKGSSGRPTFTPKREPRADMRKEPPSRFWSTCPG